MFRYAILAAFCLLALVSCQAADETVPADPQNLPAEAPDIAESPPADMPELADARGFMTVNPSPPANAKYKTPGSRARDAEGRPYGHDLLGTPLPRVAGTLNTGETFDSTKLKRWTVIRIWGVWCHDSRHDAPYAEALRSAINQDPNLDFITVHVPASDTRLDENEMFPKYGTLKAYLDKNNFDWPTLIDRDASLRTKLEVEWTPSYLVVSPDGIVRGFRTDLNGAGDEAVKDFIRDISKLRARIGNLPAPATLMKIGPGGAGFLSGPTPFSLNAMQSAFPGFGIVTTAAPSFELSLPRHGKLFTVFPDWTLGHVAKVSTKSAAVKGPGGETIGAYSLSQLPADTQKRCTPDPDAPKTRIVCPASGSEDRFSYVFAATEPKALVEMNYEPPMRK